MNSVVKEGIICVKEYGIEFCVCKLKHFLNSDGTYKYVFIPNYSVISLLDSSVFQGIPGLNLDLKKQEYVRENVIPTFISERVPSENREDLYELLASVNMDYIDPIEYLIRTNKQYFGDNLYVIPYKEQTIINMNNIDFHKTNNQGIIKAILCSLAQGNTVIFNGITINDYNRREVFFILLGLYLKSLSKNKNEQKLGIEKAKKENKYKGRKEIIVDELIFLETLKKVKEGKLTAKMAASRLGISIDKYYRFKKKLQK